MLSQNGHVSILYLLVFESQAILLLTKYDLADISGMLVSWLELLKSTQWSLFGLQVALGLFFVGSDQNGCQSSARI